MNDKFKIVIWDTLKILLSSGIAVCITYLTFSKQYNANEEARLNDDLNKIFEMNLQYPYLEDSLFISRWDQRNYPDNDSSYRYQTYCEYVFNFSEKVCEYYNYNKSKIDKFIDLEDLLIDHKIWWNLPEQKNSNSYPERFKKFVDAYF
jgi:hypothetical protein